MQRPLVSVLTPVYQGEAFVGETIASVLEQTYGPIEHILVDDGSTDGTRSILLDAARRNPERVTVIARDSRRGPCARRNDALDAAAGSLIAWLDHDDLWEPTKIERQVGALESEPGAVVCFTQFEEFDHATGETLARSRFAVEGDFLRRLFVHGCFVASSTAVFRRSALDRRARRFRDTDFSFGDDYYLWLTLLLDGSAAVVDEPLTKLRRHSGNESTRLGQTNSELRALRLLEEFLARTPDARERLADARRPALARHWAAAAEWELTRGSRRRAASFAVRAAASDRRAAAGFVRRRASALPRGVARRVRRSTLRQRATTAA